MKTITLSLTLAGFAALTSAAFAQDITGDRLKVGSGHILEAIQSTIGGGLNHTIQSNATLSVIGGGVGNKVQDGATASVIGGGDKNTIGNNSVNSTISGGRLNAIQVNAGLATIAGGHQNSIQADASWSTISGGADNVIRTMAKGSTISGGVENSIQALPEEYSYSTVAGGRRNNIESAVHSTISGGFQNTIKDGAHRSTIGGGNLNVIGPSAAYSTIPGGQFNAVNASYGFAAGYRAKANHQSGFVWSGFQDEMDFETTAPNQFLIRASGGVGIGTANPQATLDVNGQINCTVLELTSDRNQKQDVLSINHAGTLERVLGLTISYWSYTNDAKVRHIGPMAQDFHAAFSVGSDDKHIGAGDLGGVALSALQGLHAKYARMSESLDEKDARIATLEQRLTQMDALAARLATVEKLMAQASPASVRPDGSQVDTSQHSNPSDETRKGSPCASLVSE